jgi:hypothetical protein
MIDERRTKINTWLLIYEWLTTESVLSLSLILQWTVSRPICLGKKHPSGVYDQICITLRLLRVCWFGAVSLTRERVCRLQLLLVLATVVHFGSDSRGTPDHILLSQFRDFPIRRLVRLAGLRWRYSNPESVQSQTYFTTGGLPSITSSRRQALETHGQ